MTLGRALAAAAVAVLVTSLSDWFFFGVWMHERYRTHPDVWRNPKGGAGEHRAVAYSAAVCALTPIGFVLACAAFGVAGLGPAAALAALWWLAVPVPTLVTNTLLMKLDPWLLVPHGLGWLAKLLLCAGTVVAFG